MESLYLKKAWTRKKIKNRWTQNYVSQICAWSNEPIFFESSSNALHLKFGSTHCWNVRKSCSKRKMKWAKIFVHFFVEENALNLVTCLFLSTFPDIETLHRRDIAVTVEILKKILISITAKINVNRKTHGNAYFTIMKRLYVKSVNSTEILFRGCFLKRHKYYIVHLILIEIIMVYRYLKKSISNDHKNVPDPEICEPELCKP